MDVTEKLKFVFERTKTLCKKEKMLAFSPLLRYSQIFFCFRVLKYQFVLTLPSIYTHFNILKKKTLGKHSGKR